MLRSIEKLRGFELVGTDDNVGKALDFYFDDERWTIRYLEVRTGSWLRNKHVLLSPLAIHRADWEHSRLLMKLSREQVEHSPDLDTDKSISRQEEAAYHRHFGWRIYRGAGADLWGSFALPAALTLVPFTEPAAALEQEGREQLKRESNPHLRSCKEVVGYHLQARDGELGHVTDFLVDDESWSLRYLVVNTRHGWFGGKHLLVATDRVERVSWTERRVLVSLTRQDVEAGLPNRPYPTDHDIHPGMR